MHIVMDTTAWISDMWLRSQPLRMLLDYAHKTQNDIVVPEVVEIETEARVVKILEEAGREVAQKVKRAQAVGLNPLPPLDMPGAVDATFSAWREQFDAKTASPVVNRVPLSLNASRRAVRRAVERRPPCHNKGEYRDALIWESLLELVKENRPSTVALISGNTKDFGARGDEVGIHPRLREEMEEMDTTVELYEGVAEFVRRYAEPVAHLTVAWVKDRISEDTLGRLIETEVTPLSTVEWRLSSMEDRELYEVERVIYVHHIDASIDDVFVWRFTDEHVEIAIHGSALLEADADCRFEPRRMWPYSLMDEVDEDRLQPSSATRTVFAEVGFYIAAKVEGDAIRNPEVDDVYNL